MMNAGSKKTSVFIRTVPEYFTILAFFFILQVFIFNLLQCLKFWICTTVIIMDQSYQVAPGLKRKSKGSTAWLTQRGTPLSVAFDKT